MEISFYGVKNCDIKKREENVPLHHKLRTWALIKCMFDQLNPITPVLSPGIVVTTVFQ